MLGWYFYVVCQKCSRCRKNIQLNNTTYISFISDTKYNLRFRLFNSFNFKPLYVWWNIIDVKVFYLSLAPWISLPPPPPRAMARSRESLPVWVSAVSAVQTQAVILMFIIIIVKVLAWKITLLFIKLMLQATNIVFPILQGTVTTKVNLV